MAKSKTSGVMISEWGLEEDSDRRLVIGGCSTLDLCNHYGTPLHVVNEKRLLSTATSFVEAFRSQYPGKLSAHFAFKCNPVPGIISIIREAGLLAEVMSEHELALAFKLGYNPCEIVVNGPLKTDALISGCLEKNVRFINVDSLAELERIEMLACKSEVNANVLLRVNPDYVPAGMNKGSATASRKGSPFGLDIKGGEVEEAIGRIRKMKRIIFSGFHFHIGTGILVTDDYRKAILRLRESIRFAEEKGLSTSVVDIGGGFGVSGSREMTTFELLLYQAFGFLPPRKRIKTDISFLAFADEVTRGIREIFSGKELPELLIEPGRCIVSPNQVLLLKVHQVKERKGIMKWIITDAGIGTLTMPTYYEHHEIVLCDDVGRKLSEHVTITGPGCFSGDIVYRNKRMPEVKPGEIIAILDSGAYFTSWESSFGYPRPAIISVSNGSHRILRSRETFENMISRDNL